MPLMPPNPLISLPKIDTKAETMEWPFYKDELSLTERFKSTQSEQLPIRIHNPDGSTSLAEQALKYVAPDTQITVRQHEQIKVAGAMPKQDTSWHMVTEYTDPLTGEKVPRSEDSTWTETVGYVLTVPNSIITVSHAIPKDEAELRAYLDSKAELTGQARITYVTGSPEEYEALVQQEEQAALERQQAEDAKVDRGNDAQVRLGRLHDLQDAELKSARSDQVELEAVREKIIAEDIVDTEDGDSFQTELKKEYMAIIAERVVAINQFFDTSRNIENARFDLSQQELTENPTELDLGESIFRKRFEPTVHTSFITYITNQRTTAVGQFELMRSSYDGLFQKYNAIAQKAFNNPEDTAQEQARRAAVAAMLDSITTLADQQYKFFTEGIIKESMDGFIDLQKQAYSGIIAATIEEMAKP